MTRTQLHGRTRARAHARAKINLGLFVGPVRERDGRHELVSVMQSISLADELTLEAIEAGGGDGLRQSWDLDRSGEGEDEIVCSGVEGDPRENLAARALRAYRDATGWNPGPLRLIIDKRIPVAAGLGGGSADAAATLRLARRLSGLDEHRGEARADELMLELAEQLGADVPAQIAPGRWLATGAGEGLHELPAPREELGVVVLPVAAELSTAAVYARADEIGSRRTREELGRIAAALEDALRTGAALPAARELLHNDLQHAAMSLCPLIEPALELARQTGPDAVFVSGSGPTVVALFLSEDRTGGDQMGGALRGGSEEPGGSEESTVDEGHIRLLPRLERARRAAEQLAGHDEGHNRLLPGLERARRAAEQLAGRIPAPIWAAPVDARLARAGDIAVVDVSVRHNHDR